ncbi:hypothetical protein [Acidobacterium sp. S8]|uniref:hypothetical protein n=1 Tax=Acidobacterium sp. S8 TaxID=1641854 RepID=UPI00131B9040|nr:hypothetical protein [Acidobacterium sp. S8]
MQLLRSSFNRCLLALLLLSAASSMALSAQSGIDEQCDGSTVDTQGPETAKAARAFLAELQAALRANDKQKIAGMVSYPVNVIHAGKRAHIRDKQTFLARYDSLFDEHLRKVILEQSAHCLFGNANGEMIGQGEVWFSELGNGSVKIITINPTAGT